MTVSHFHDLTHSQRLRILNGVRADLRLLGGSPRLTDDELEDVVRCAIDAHWDVVGEDEVLEAFDRGVAEGDQAERVIA